MSSGNDDFELDEEELDAGAQELERHGDAIYSSIKDYIAEHDLPEDVVSGMLLVMAIQLRMVGYAFDTEQPSATGLKLDLDRFRNEMEEAVRAAKKDAEEFIAEVKRMPEELEDDLEDETMRTMRRRTRTRKTKTTMKTRMMTKTTRRKKISHDAGGLAGKGISGFLGPIPSRCARARLAAQ